MITGVIHHYLAARAELDTPGSPFATTTEVVRGVPLKVFAACPPDMRVLWENSAGHGDKDYLVYEDERYTYAEVHAQVRKLAAHLVANGVHPGSRVAIAMRNYPEWVVSYWASVCVGAAAVGMNAWWTAPEMEYALNDSEPIVLIADDERLERLNHMPAQRPMHIISVRTDRTARRVLEGRPGKMVSATLGDDGRLRSLVARYPADDDAHFTRLRIERNPAGGWVSMLETAALEATTRLGTVLPDGKPCSFAFEHIAYFGAG